MLNVFKIMREYTKKNEYEKWKNYDPLGYQDGFCTVYQFEESATFVQIVQTTLSPAQFQATANVWPHACRKAGWLLMYNQKRQGKCRLRWYCFKNVRHSSANHPVWQVLRHMSWPIGIVFIIHPFHADLHTNYTKIGAVDSALPIYGDGKVGTFVSNNENVLGGDLQIADNGLYEKPQHHDSNGANRVLHIFLIRLFLVTCRILCFDGSFKLIAPRSRAD